MSEDISLSRHDYSALARLLHRLALQSAGVREAAFDMEQMLVRPQAAAIQQVPHVFIAGLARSGTTILLQALHSSGDFHSLTYRHMPFVLMPNLWLSLSGQQRGRRRARERAHGDGIMVDEHAPEALEEVFWKTYSDGAYRHRTCLVPHPVGDNTIHQFRNYVAAILHGRQNSRYLSKNNNNVLRLPAVRAAFPNAVVIVPFRSPLAQAQSLLRQHHRFCTLQTANPFIRSYMNWLGHHEFGLSHRPFIFSHQDETALEGLDAAGLDYWLTIWINTYRHLLNEPGEAIFVSHEACCHDPAPVMHHIAEAARVRIDVAHATGQFRPSEPMRAADASPALMATAAEMHERLMEKHARTAGTW